MNMYISSSATSFTTFRVLKNLFTDHWLRSCSVISSLVVILCTTYLTLSIYYAHAFAIRVKMQLLKNSLNWWKELRMIIRYKFLAVNFQSLVCLL